MTFAGTPLGHARAYVNEAVNTSLTTWRWDGTQANLVRYNDAAHLVG